MTSEKTISAEKRQLRKAIQVIGTLENKITALESNAREPIAIIGMSCRFPGGVNTRRAVLGTASARTKCDLRSFSRLVVYKSPL